MRVLVDVGAWDGETAHNAIKLGFDYVHAIEPSPESAATIQPHTKIRIHNVGLGKKAGYQTLHNSGSNGASVFKDKPNLSGKHNGNDVQCRIERASSWVDKHVSCFHKNWLKINCEGSECDILEDLYSEGMLKLFKGIAVDFDVLKIPSQKHRMKEVLDLLDEPGIHLHNLTGNYSSDFQRLSCWVKFDG